MKKAFKIIYIVLFLLICFVPLAFMPFVKNDASLEKRELTPLPAYMIDGRLNVDFSTQFESWFNDRIPFRPQLLTAANAIKGELLHASTSNVIVGKDGWLYYDSESEDYMNTNAMSDAEINAAAVSISLMQENVESKNGHFLFVPMPNKASVYDEYMPACYTKASENNMSRLMARMDEVGVNYIDMKKLMTDNKDKGLYHRRDSHWNYQGALLGYNAMMDALGKNHKTYADLTPSLVKDWRGDLDKLLYPAGGVLDDQYYYEDAYYTRFMFMSPVTPGSPDATKAQLENLMSDKEEGDDNIKTKSKAVRDGSSLFMARDSFGRALLPFMIDNYEEAVFKRTDSPDINSIGENTDFIYEIVERNLVRLSEKAPFMYAPVREYYGIELAAGETANEEVTVATLKDVLPANTVDSGEITAFCDVEGYGVRLYGILPEEKPIGDGRVYIVLDKGEGEASEKIVYEAFPIYEKNLIQTHISEGEEETTKNGYSAILEKADYLSGNYKVTVVTGDKAYDAGTIEVK